MRTISTAMYNRAKANELRLINGEVRSDNDRLLLFKMAATGTSQLLSVLLKGALISVLAY